MSTCDVVVLIESESFAADYSPAERSRVDALLALLRLSW